MIPSYTEICIIPWRSHAALVRYIVVDVHLKYMLEFILVSVERLSFRMILASD